MGSCLDTDIDPKNEYLWLTPLTFGLEDIY